MQIGIKYNFGNVDGEGRLFGQVYLVVTDDSGNPINGNNVVVQYQELLNGVLTGDVLSKTIPGQSVLIYNGLLHYNTTNIAFTLVGDSAPGVPSPPLLPDLKIQAVEILKKADVSGNNGLATIIATSSTLPIQYFIDDVEYTADQNTAGITVTAGVHTAKVTDPSEAVVTQQFTVLRADVGLTKTPTLILNGYTSRWSAAFNPIVFQYNRTDYIITAIAQDDTTLKPAITINSALNGLTVGDYIYLSAGLDDNDNIIYKGAYKVLSFTGSTIIIDTDYVAAAEIGAGSYCNIDVLRPYYKIITQIKYVDPVTGLFTTIQSTNRPNGAGIVIADISNFLQSILSPIPDLSDYTAVNYRDMGLGASYQVSYAEIWDGSGNPVFIDVGVPFYVVFSAKQLQENGGGNLYDYVTQPGGGLLAKWLCDFAEPSYSLSFPFDLGFIYSEQIAGRQLYYKYTALDINRQALGTNNYDAYLLNENGSYLLNNDTSKLLIARQQLVNTPIVEHVGVNRLLINQDFGPTCCFIAVQLFYDSDDEVPVAIPVTEEKIVRVDRTIAPNPVYVRWIGLNGSWNYYRFNYNQTVTLDIQNPVIISDYVTDWQNGEGIERVISKSASKKVQLYADLLDKNDIDGLRSIKFSPIVQVLTNNYPLKWQTIILNSSTFTEYDTINGQTDFSITYNLPSINIQNQ